MITRTYEVHIAHKDIYAKRITRVLYVSMLMTKE